MEGREEDEKEKAKTPGGVRSACGGGGREVSSILKREKGGTIAIGKRLLHLKKRERKERTEEKAEFPIASILQGERGRDRRREHA